MLEIKNLKLKQWGAVISSGLLLGIHYILWFESLRFTSVASSTVLVTMQPLFAFIGSYFLFGERLKKLAIFGGVLSIIGSCVIVWGDFQIGGTALLGDVLALLGEPVGTCILAYFILGQGISYNQILGSVIILIGIFIFLTGKTTRTKKEN